MLENQRIAVIIPTYNAESIISAVINGIPDFVDSIYIIDDASTDKTLNIIKRLNSKKVHVIALDKNQGVGGATIAGFNEASNNNIDILVKMDSDNQMDPNYLKNLIAPLINGVADMAKGNRFLFKRELKFMPKNRIIGNFILSLLTKLASGYWNIFDPTNGYLTIQSKSYRLLDRSELENRYFFETSLLVEAGMNRLVVKDVDIPARYQGEKSGLNILQTIITFPHKLIRSTLKRFWIQYIIRDFGLVPLYGLIGGALLIFGTIFGIIHWYISYVKQQFASTGTVMIAALTIIIGIQFLTHSFAMDSQNVPKTPRNIPGK